jgi:Uma2 family endonuclease
MVVADTLAPPAPSTHAKTVAETADRAVVLHDVKWETYQALRLEEDNNHLRMTYDQGVLEVMSPSRKHARLAGLVSWIIGEWAIARRVKIAIGGDVTLSRQDIDRGLEADHCYWIGQYAAVHNKDEIDLTVDPPPDLALEVEVTRSAVPKLPIYESLRVPEVWRWHNGAFTVLVLSSQAKYVQQADSVALPGFPFRLVEELIVRRRHEDDTALVFEFRQAISQRQD